MVLIFNPPQMNILQQIIKRRQEEFEKKYKRLFGVYNAEILNKFQDQYLMEKGPGCEKILYPVLEKATKDFLNPPDDGYIRKYNPKELSSHNQETVVAILEAVKDWAKKNRRYENNPEGYDGILDTLVIDEEELQSYINSTLQNIKNNQK